MSATRPLATFSRLVLRQTLTNRPLSTTTRLSADTHPSKQRDAQEDREKMNPEANEYAKSGTDDAAAKQGDAAFDPNISDPKEAQKKAGEGQEVNPLDASPANMELSEGTSEQESGQGKKPQGSGDTTGDK